MDILSILPSFGNLLFTIGAFVLALLVIVAVHEYGHYIVGRWSGIHTEVFSLGMGPVLWSRVDKHGTKWQIAAIPAGGYCKFLGDANAASGVDSDVMKELAAKERRRSMHGAPLWARAATVAAGPIFNFILSILVFSAIIGWRGFASDPLTIAELRPVPYEMNLQAGDEILSIQGIETPKLEDFSDFIDSLPEAEVLDYFVRRQDEIVEIAAPFPYPPMVIGLSPGSAAMDAGMQVGDVITQVDGVPVFRFADLREIVGNSDGASLALDVWRNGESLNLEMTPKRVDLPLSEGGFETRWLIGITGGLLFEPQTARPGPIAALGHGFDQTKLIITSSLSGLYHVVVGTISSCNLRGPVGIAQTTSDMASQGLLSFIWLVAVLSTSIGLLNLFPVPILDGGHLVFYAYEAVAGRPPNDKALRLMMAIGLALILSLMVFALTNDFLCP